MNDTSVRKAFSNSLAAIEIPRRTVQQRRQALIDVEERAFGGIFIYLPYWLAITAIEGLNDARPMLVVTVAAFWALVALARYGLHRDFAVRVGQNEARARALLLVLLLGNGLAYSLVCVAAQHWEPLMPLLQPLILAGGIICAVATMTMSIEPVVRYGMPTVMLVPFLIGQAIPFTPVNALASVVVALFMLYLIRASRRVYDYYWSAVEARALLELRAAELEQLSITDPLTQIYNRLHFERRLAEEWSRAVRQQEWLSLLVIDIDHFKRLNDAHGHPFGDRCLIATAAELRRHLYREVDIVARYGGEEFVVVLPDTGGEAAVAVAERLRGAVAAIALPDGDTMVHFTCSIGVATTEPRWSRETPATAIARADRALYEAKAAGRDRVVAAGATPDDNAVPRLRTEVPLHTTLH